MKIEEKKEGIFLVVFFVLLFSFLIPTLTNAKLVPCDLTGSNACTICDFFKMIKNIIDFLLFEIIPVLATLMIAIGGVIYIVSEGSQEMLSLSKRIFTSVAYGLLIIYGSWLLVNLFFQIIGVATWTGLKTGWWQLNCN